MDNSNYEQFDASQYSNTKVADVSVDDRSATIKLEDGRRIELTLKGDCCSHSYFTDAGKQDLRSLVGERIQTMDEVYEGSQDTGEYGDVTRIYALVIRTDRQSLSIDWRNDSNGYYGGSIYADAYPAAN